MNTLHLQRALASSRGFSKPSAAAQNEAGNIDIFCIAQKPHCEGASNVSRLILSWRLAKSALEVLKRAEDSSQSEDFHLRLLNIDPLGLADNSFSGCYGKVLLEHAQAKTHGYRSLLQRLKLCIYSSFSRSISLIIVCLSIDKSIHLYIFSIRECWEYILAESSQGGHINKYQYFR